MNPILNYAIQFILGGGIIVGMNILASHTHPKYAALLYALPIQFTLAAIFVYLGTNQGTIQQLTQSSIIYVFAMIGFIILFYYLTKQFSFWTSMGTAYLFFIIVVAIVLKVTP